MYSKDAQGKDEAYIADTVGLHISNRSKVCKISVATITDRQQTNARHREEETPITDSQYHHLNEATCYLFFRKMKVERTHKNTPQNGPNANTHTHTQWEQQQNNE